MGKQKNQGTAWETFLVKFFKALGLGARRLAEGGSKDKGDVYVSGTPQDKPLIVAVAWKRLVKGTGARRVADGEKEVVVITLEDFGTLVQRARVNVFIEAKATERLNVTRVLAKAREKVRRNHE